MVAMPAERRSGRTCFLGFGGTKVAAALSVRGEVTAGSGCGEFASAVRPASESSHPETFDVSGGRAVSVDGVGVDGLGVSAEG